MYFSRAALALALFISFSCAKPDPVHRVAILPFENLSSGNTAENWIGRAISEEVAGQLEGTRHSAVVSSAAILRADDFLGGQSEWSAAVAAGANRIVSGYYSVRDGRLSISAVMGSQVISASGAEDDVLHLCEQIARAIDEEAQPPITGSARALRAYALGQYTEAIQLDPDFGLPYVALAQEAIGKHDSAEFSSVFAASRSRGAGIAAVDRALLNLDDAEMHATPSTRVDALYALVKITPADPFHLRELADAELAINRFAEAADHYRRLATLLPADAEPVNQMGYALLYAGDESGATKAFEDFRRLDHGSANSFDSTGDADFFFNHFADAERDYVNAYERDPNLGEGTEPIKVAWTRLMRKDPAGAMQFVEQYLRDREKQSDPLAKFRAALVEELAGQHQRAKDSLTPYLSSPISDVRTAAEGQLAVFEHDARAVNPPLQSALTALFNKDYAQGIPQWRKLAEESSPVDWWTRTIYARVLAETGQSQESARYARFTPIPQPLRGVGYDSLWYPWILGTRKP